jgi:uncharacterized protein (TIGR00255 family)
VELWLLVEPGGGASGLSLDLEAAREAKRLLESLRSELGLEEPVALEHLLRFNVIAAAKDQAPADSDALVGAFMELAAKALDQLMAMREAEGAVLAGDLSRRLATLAGWLDEIKELAADAPVAATKRYQARLEELAETLSDPARLAQEAAILAEKMDITEEITRFGSHIKSVQALLAQAGDPIGRRLEFILQEMVREVNTMGSKSQSKPISDLVLNFKSELEKIREQALNIE